MYCRKCGKEIEDDSVFCRYCGESFSNNTNKKNNRPLILGITIVTLVIMVIVLIVVLLLSNKSDENKNVLEEPTNETVSQTPDVLSTDDEVNNYINSSSLTEWMKNYKSFSEEYDNASENYTTGEAFYAKLKDIILPYTQTMVSNANELEKEVSNEEIKKVNDILVEATECFNSAIQSAINSVEKQDNDLINKGVEYMNKGNALMDNYTTELGKLLKKYKVDMPDAILNIAGMSREEFNNSYKTTNNDDNKSNSPSGTNNSELNVADLIGKDINEAKKTASSCGVNLVEKYGYSDDRSGTPEGIIYSSVPRFGKFKEGDSVTVLISKGITILNVENPKIKYPKLISSAKIKTSNLYINKDKLSIQLSVSNSDGRYKIGDYYHYRDKVGSIRIDGKKISLTHDNTSSSNYDSAGYIEIELDTDKIGTRNPQSVSMWFYVTIDDKLKKQKVSFSKLNWE